MLSAPSVRRAAWLLAGVTAAGFAAAANGSAELRATASRACAYNNASVWKASPRELRAAVVCLINRTRTRNGLPPIYQQRRLDRAAQGHTNQMVGRDFFGHGGIPASSPGVRISASGFNWGAYGEAIATGYRTPWGAVHAWLASTEHCQLLLSPTFRYVGIGVNPRGVTGWTGNSGTWTADLALPLGSGAPSGNWGPADGCPY